MSDDEIEAINARIDALTECISNIIKAISIMNEGVSEMNRHLNRLTIAIREKSGYGFIPPDM